jgi:hypothetical protein
MLLQLDPTDNEERTMIATVCEQSKVDGMTLDGLDETQPALELLKETSRAAGDMLQHDVATGASMVIEVANSLHQFIQFEQAVVQLFAVKTSAIRSNDDSLMEVERDMGDLLEEFNVSLEAMDMVGIGTLMQDAVPELLTRFQQMLAILRTEIYDVSNP